MNNAKRLIEALQKAGYKVRYNVKKWGRGYAYTITGIGKGNYKYAENAIKKAESLVKATRPYNLSEKALEQRAKAREAKTKLNELTPEEKKLYKEMKELWKNKFNRKNYQKRHPGATKSPSIDTILKVPKSSRLNALRRRVNELRGIESQDEIDMLAEQLEIAGRETGIDVYDVVSKLRSGDYTMTKQEFSNFRDILIDSNNPNYWRKQVNPDESILKLIDKLNAFFNKAK